MAKRGRKRIPRGNCLQCGASLDDKPAGQTHCSRECHHESMMIERAHKCPWCEQRFTPAVNRRQTFCSKTCAAKAQHQARRLSGSGETRAYHRKAVGACKFCGGPATRSSAIICGAENCKEALVREYYFKNYPHRRPEVAHKCAECGDEFFTEYGDKRRVFCSQECRNRHHCRVAKATRRARICGAGKIDSIDPIKVFRRDGWKCYLCGAKTPRRLRGGVDDRAPELEHVVPISRGGTHTYSNVRCACRKCNQEKSDLLLSEMGIDVDIQLSLDIRAA